VIEAMACGTPVCGLQQSIIHSGTRIHVFECGNKQIRALWHFVLLAFRLFVNNSTLLRRIAIQGIGASWS